MKIFGVVIIMVCSQVLFAASSQATSHQQQLSNHHWRNLPEQRLENQTERQAQHARDNRKFEQQSAKQRAAQPMARRDLRAQRPSRP